MNSGCPTTDGTNTASNCLEQTQEATELDNFIQANSLPRGLEHHLLPRPAADRRDCSDDHTVLGQLPEHPARPLLRLPQLVQHRRSRTDALGRRWVSKDRRWPLRTAATGARRTETSTPRPRINALSHWDNETMTGPTNGGSTVDGTGENGDKCNFNYGPSTQSTGRS